MHVSAAKDILTTMGAMKHRRTRAPKQVSPQDFSNWIRSWWLA